MWEFQRTTEFEKRFRKWPKKHSRELVALMANLQTVFDALQEGAKVAHLKFGFLRTEGKGLMRISQQGAGSGAKEFRLYIYPEEKDGKEVLHVLHVLTVGDKSSQSRDIAECHSTIENLLAHSRSD